MNKKKKIIEGCYVLIDNNRYKVLGKTMYVSESAPDIPYAKILLEDHFVLVISPTDDVAYFGKNEGHISAFDDYPNSVVYNGIEYTQIAHDYQIVTRIVFGSPLLIEGEVEYWDYDCGDKIVSIAVTSREKVRADVVAKYIGIADINVM